MTLFAQRRSSQLPEGRWQWFAGGMSGRDSGHLDLIARWVRGEVVNNTVGIKVHGGPFHGRTRIVTLDERHQPPQRQRARGSRKSPPADMWHVYDLVPAPDTTAGWSYDYAGTEPCDVP